MMFGQGFLNGDNEEGEGNICMFSWLYINGSKGTGAVEVGGGGGWIDDVVKKEGLQWGVHWVMIVMMNGYGQRWWWWLLAVGSDGDW